MFSFGIQLLYILSLAPLTLQQELISLSCTEFVDKISPGGPTPHVQGTAHMPGKLWLSTICRGGGKENTK